jgi:hypothetical protein
MNQTPMPATAPRPKLLTVLCIISFIMGVWNLAGGLNSAFTGDPERELAVARKRMERSMDQLNGAGAENVAKVLDSVVVMAERSAEKAKPLGYSAIVLSLAGMAGVWLMWQLRRGGFWVYTAASIIGLVVPMVLLGGGLMTMLALGLGSLLAVAFIVLYATQLKYMR